MNQAFRVGVTRDFLKPDGSPCFGNIGLGMLDEGGIGWEYLADQSQQIEPRQLAEYDALLLLGPRVSDDSLRGVERLKLIARFGVGYDNVDVSACNENRVLLTITPDGVRRPVAVAAMTFVLSLAGKLLEKDRLTRSGRWSEKLDHMGQGLTGRTLGVIGLGNIGREIFRLASAFDMRHVGFDPYVTRDAAADAGIEWLELDNLLRTADFVCVCCALTPDTRHLIDGRRIARMKPSAYLINVARGPIVDQQALTAALVEGRIAGAGLDVFEQEPIDPEDPLLKLDNVILAPHALCWTDECFAGNGRSACESILDVAAGRIPRYVVNREVLQRPGMREKLRLVS